MAVSNAVWLITAYFISEWTAAFSLLVLSQKGLDNLRYAGSEMLGHFGVIATLGATITTVLFISPLTRRILPPDREPQKRPVGIALALGAIHLPIMTTVAACWPHDLDDIGIARAFAVLGVFFAFPTIVGHLVRRTPGE